MFKKSKKENESKENEVKKDKVKFKEKISLRFRRSYLVDGTRVFLIAIILLILYSALNLWANNADLPEIDMTENKLYTLTDTSKKAVEQINQDIKIYVYGFDEKSNIIDLLKQYNEANNKITFEMLDEEKNYAMVQEYNLESGYYVLIMKSGDSEKIVDSSSFTTYDYTTYQSVDVAEQTITNSLLALNEENKPKIYFTQTHGEYGEDEIAILLSYLKNEAFDVSFINLATAGKVPDDCDVLAIISPTIDLFDVEVQSIKDYINKGGELYFSFDVVSQDTFFPNIQSILDLYGVSVKKGYILEYENGSALSSSPYIFVPQVSSTNKITRDIYTDSVMWLVYASKLEFKSDDELQNLNVEKEILLNSSDEAIYVTDLSSDLTTAAKSAEVGKADIAAILTKTLPTNEGSEEENVDTDSKLIIASTSRFIYDYSVPALSANQPLSNIKSNKDFVINSMAFLGNKNNILTIRKDYASATYLPTQTENIVVIAIIILIPLFIIVFGIMIWAYRQRRK